MRITPSLLIVVALRLTATLSISNKASSSSISIPTPNGCFSGTGIPVILIPGLFASTLLNASNGAMVYGDGYQMLTGFGGNDVLSLGWNWTAAGNNNSLPTQILNNKLIPGEAIYEISYGSIRYPQYIYLKNAILSEGRTFCGMAYDWRLTGQENVARVQAYILNVSAAYNSHVHVMGHSLGGVLAYGAIAQNASVRAVTHSALFISAPFVYQAYTLTHLAEGQTVIYNVNFESRDVVFTLPYAYALLSTEREYNRSNTTMCGLYWNGTLLTKDYYNTTMLKQYKIGPYHNRNVTAQEELHIQNSFAVAKAFRDSLKPSNGLVFPPSAVLTGNGATGCSYDVNPDGSIGAARSNAPGDSIVVKEYAIPEVPVSNVYIGSPYVNHVLLAWDTDQILGILQDLGVPNVGNGNGNGNGNSNSASTVSYSIAMIIVAAIMSAMMIL